MDLQDAVAVVTGGHRRVGRAISLALARRGCHVHVTYRTHEADALDTVQVLTALGVRGRAHRVDLADAAAVVAFAEELWVECGGVDVLVNSASVFPETPLGPEAEAAWAHCLAVNLRAPFLLSQRLGLRMKAGRGGAIVNVLDWAVDRPYKGYAPYFASKAGLLGLTRAMAVELAPSVRVNGVAPGAVLLPEGTTTEDRAEIEGATPLGRVGSPAEVAAAVVFLVADTDYATGSIVTVDGGRGLADARRRS